MRNNVPDPSKTPKYGQITTKLSTTKQKPRKSQKRLSSSNKSKSKHSINRMYILNTEGMDPSINSQSRWKLPYIIENHLSDNVFTPVIFVTEHWLKSHITDAQVLIPNYTVFRADRDDQRIRGGALLYIHNDLPTSNTATYDDLQCQAVICTLPLSHTVIASVYRPPDTTEEGTIKVLSFINKYIKQSTQNQHMELIITGDFNLKGINWDNLTIKHDSEAKSANALLAFMADNLLSQYVNVPTRNNNILDLFLTNNPNLTLHVEAEKTKLSDHNLVTVLTQQTLKPLPPKTKPIFNIHTFRNLLIQKSNIEDIRNHLQTLNWDELRAICPEQDFPELVRLTVLQICEIYCTLKTERSRTKSLNKYVKERTILNRKRRRFNARLQAAKSVPDNNINVNKIEEELNNVIKQIKTSHHNQKLQDENRAIDAIKENPKYFFSYSKKSRKTKSTIGPLIDNNKQLKQNPKQMADMLQEQYASVFSDPEVNTDNHPSEHPLISILEDIDFNCEDITSAIKEIGEFSACGDSDIPSVILKNCAEELSYPIWLIWKYSFDTGWISPAFKSQLITPVFKKGSKAKAANYRPISLTPHVIKIFGRVIRKTIVKHLEENQIICKNQHGFMKGRSCLTQLIVHIDTILKNFLEGNDTDSLYLDFAKAFDKVDHKILLNKLHACGIRGKLLEWLKSYLSNRHQTVVVNGAQSYPAEVKSGVPQGTVLGPILFLIYINDLSQCIKHSLVSHFADDTRILKAITCSNDVALLQEDLHETIAWSTKNKMVLNEDKFELICHTVSKTNPLKELPYTTQFYEYITADGTVISSSDSVRDLGANVCPTLTWSPHINIISDKGRQLIAWVLSVFSDRSEYTMMSLYKSLIRSRLEYLSPLWHPSKIEDIKMLEGVQRLFTSKIKGLSQYSYWERLEKLKLMSLQRRRERFIIINVWKIINGISPNDIHLQTVVSGRRGVRVKVPPLNRTATAHCQSLYDNSFGVVGPKLWNTIPTKLTHITNQTTFKTALSKYLAQIPDHPPIQGIASENSLLDMNRLTMMNNHRLQVVPPGGRAPAVAAASVPATVAAAAAEENDGPHQIH